MLSIKNLHAGYENKKIIKDFSLEVEQGNIISVIGPNGCGKSTLLNCIMRFITPTKGSIFLDNEDISTKSIKERSKKIAILTQQHSIMGTINVENLVSYGRLPHKKWYERNNDEDYKIIEDAMINTNILQYREQFLNNLSGGEQQRVWIAMALAQTPKLLLLDEPTTYLDIAHQLELMHLVKKINYQKKATIIMVLHDLNQAAEYSDKIVLMKDGTIFDYGSPENVLTPENLATVYNIRCKISINDYNDKLIITPIGIYK